MGFDPSFGQDVVNDANSIFTSDFEVVVKLIDDLIPDEFGIGLRNEQGVFQSDGWALGTLVMNQRATGSVSQGYGQRYKPDPKAWGGFQGSCLLF